MLEGSRRTGRIEPLLTAAPYAALGVYALVCVLWWVEADWRPDWDSAIYILAARSLADGEGYSYLGRPFLLRPPGLSWLISIALPAEGFDAAALNHAVMAFAATAVAAVYFALVRPYGRWMAVGVALLAGTSQLVVARFNWVLSEFPFVTLVFLAVGLFQLSAADGARGWLASLAAGACAAGAFYVRSVAVLLLPGMLLVGLVGRRGGQRWRAGLSVALAAALCVPWLWHVRAAAEDAEVPSQQLLLSDYATAMFRVDPGDPYSARLSLSDWRVRVERNGAGLLSDLSRAVLSRDDTSLGWVLLLPVAAGLIASLRRRASLLEWFGLAYGLLLLTFFTHAPRLFVPLVPLAYLYLLVATSTLGSRLAQRTGRRAWSRVLPGGVFALLVGVNLLGLPESLDARRWSAGDARLGAVWRDVHAVADWIRAHTSESSTLLSHDAPIYSLLTGRRVYSYRFLRDPAKTLSRYGADFVVIDAQTPRARRIEQLVAPRAQARWNLPSRRPGGRIAIYQVSGP